jgi:hypothetical protein
MDPPRQTRTDQMPRSAAVDPPLSLDARTPGPRGLVPKIWLAGLALVILAALTVLAWTAAHASRKGALDKPPSQIEQHL